MHQFERLMREERDTEFSLERVIRVIQHEGADRPVRLPRFVWAGFDLLIFSDAMTAKEIVTTSQLGTRRYPGRSFEDNLENFILHAVDDLKPLLR